MAKRGLCILLAVLTLFALAVPAFAAEPEMIDSGTCGGQEGGTNMTWTLSAKGVLTISGQGLMADYNADSGSPAPWSGHAAEIKTVVLEGRPATIGNYAFAECGALSSIVIPSSVDTIGVYAFRNCGKLTGVDIPDSVTSIENGAFYGCGLTSVKIPSSVTSIGDGALSGCRNLTSVDIPNGVTSIGDNEFFGCLSLTNVKIPSSVTSIGEYAFRWCEKLTSVDIPNGVTSIGDEAFAYSGLKSITIPSSVTSIGEYAFQQCESLTSVKIQKGVTDIPENAFIDCVSLTSVDIPNSVTSIGDSAFSHCESLTSVDIPNSVTSIGEGAFSSCYSLTSITVLNPNCDIHSDSADSETLGGPDNTVVSGYAGSTAETYAKTYGYTFKAVDEKPVQLAAPTVKIAQTKSGIKVTWNAVEGSPRYMVYYKENGGGWKKIGTTTSTSYTRAASKLKSGKTYQFTVRCCAADKKTLLSAYKASNSLKYSAELAAPTVKISVTSGGGIKVSWNKVSGAPRYMVYYKENGGSWHRIGTTTKTSYTRAASKLKSGKTYQFTVRCCDSDKTTLLSAYKASNSLKYLATPKVTIAKASGGIKVSWNKISGASRYAVYYKENGGSWHKIGTTTKTSYTRAASKLKSGKTYQFTVRCCSADKTTMLSGYTASSRLKYTK